MQGHAMLTICLVLCLWKFGPLDYLPSVQFCKHAMVLILFFLYKTINFCFQTCCYYLRRISLARGLSLLVKFVLQCILIGMQI